MHENHESHETPPGRIRLGIARCLLGEPVRYDGTHKLNRYLRDTLGAYVDWVPVCPEVECGMPVPREAVRLAGDPAAPRLVGRSSSEDWTERMRAWGERRLEGLADEELCGYVFRHGSPSNGMRGIKVHQDGGRTLYDGVGLWVRMVMDRFPALPVEDDGRLNDPGIRENFIARVFTLHRWNAMTADGWSPGALVEFHTRHKLLVMAHNVECYRALGKIVARAGAEPPGTLFPEYRALLFKALGHRPTVKKHVNTLQHALGHFKKELDGDDKREMLELIDRYHRGLVPLVAPITLLAHHVRRFGKAYLDKQYYLHPYPAELMLRNHV